MVHVQVPATAANLGPGFDCLGMALGLYNVVEMACVSQGLFIEVQGEGVAEIARDEQNIVYKAAQMVFKQVGFEPGGLRIKLINRIPIARGLGSSASAIIGGIVAANKISGEQFNIKEMLSLAYMLEGHPDNVAPALLGGIVVSVVVDGEVRYLKILPPTKLKGVVAIPDFLLITKTSREILPQQVNFQDAVFNVGRVALLVTAFSQGDFSVLGTAMEDRLHQPFRAGMVPGIKKVMAAARLAGASGVALSGAGPAVIAFADNNFKLIARVMEETFRESGVRVRVMILNPTSVGVRVLEQK